MLAVEEGHDMTAEYINGLEANRLEEEVPLPYTYTTDTIKATVCITLVISVCIAIAGFVEHDHLMDHTLPVIGKFLFYGIANLSMIYARPLIQYWEHRNEIMSISWNIVPCSFFFAIFSTVFIGGLIFFHL